MASLRDVLNHIGRPVRIVRDGAEVATVLGTERSGTVLLEAKAEPAVGDELVLTDGRRLRVVEVRSETVHERLDHYRARVTAI